MDSENLTPQEELTRLFKQIDAAADLEALRPIYFRLSEIVQRHPDDFDVVVAASEIKERLLARGRVLKNQGPRPAPPAPVAAPEPQPPAPAPSLPDPPEFHRLPETTPLSAEPPLPHEDSTPAETVLLPPPTGKPPRRPLALILAAVVLVLAVVAVSAVLIRRRKPGPPPAAATNKVQLDVATSPPGASVHVTAGQTDATCTSNCRLAVAPETYQVTATLDGFEPAAVTIPVSAAHPAAVTLTLRPQPQAVRLLSDLEQGKVILDGQPAGDLQEGQLVLDKAGPGSHTVKVAGSNRDASFSFEIADARMPVVSGPIQARNVIAVLVASFGKQARLVTNAGPWKLAVNGQPEGDAGPAGIDLTNFKPGVNEILVGVGKDQHNIIENFPAAPVLTVFLKSDINAGTLIVSTNQDDARVFLNGKEYRRRTQHGQLRIQTIGPVAVRVAKNGFLEEPPKTVEVKRGAEVRVQFDLKPQPQFAALEIRGGTPGAEVLLDQRSAGSVGPDGTFTLSGVKPGDHALEIRREKHLPKRLQRTFQAGQTVALSGADVVLAAANGTIRFTRNVPSAAITYHRAGEQELHEIPGSQVDLPAGSYVFSAAAPGFVGASINVQLGAGDAREVDFKLAAERVALPPPPPPAGMADFEDAPTWRREGDVWVRKGGGFSAFRLTPKGVFTFTVELLKGGGIFRPGQVRWCVQHVDARNYLLYEMDRKNLWAGVVDKGRRLERSKTAHGLDKQKAFTIQVEITPDRLVTKVMAAGEWKVIDTFDEPGRDYTQGKFGFLIQGNDEIAISDFKFVPR